MAVRGCQILCGRRCEWHFAHLLFSMQQERWLGIVDDRDCLLGHADHSDSSDEGKMAR